MIDNKAVVMSGTEKLKKNKIKSTDVPIRFVTMTINCRELKRKICMYIKKMWSKAACSKDALTLNSFGQDRTAQHTFFKADIVYSIP